MNGKLAVGALLLLVALIVVSWYTQKETTNSQTSNFQQLIIKTGTISYECVGYCTDEFVVTSEKITYIKSSRENSSLPEVKKEIPISSDRWNKLSKLIGTFDVEEFTSSLSKTTPCSSFPNCVITESREFIQITDDTKNTSVSFDVIFDSVYATEIDKLIKELRSIRGDVFSQFNK